jgi:hypothetical protein
MAETFSAFFKLLPLLNHEQPIGGLTPPFMIGLLDVD